MTRPGCGIVRSGHSWRIVVGAEDGANVATAGAQTVKVACADDIVGNYLLHLIFVG